MTGKKFKENNVSAKKKNNMWGKGRINKIINEFTLIFCLGIILIVVVFLNLSFANRVKKELRDSSISVIIENTNQGYTIIINKSGDIIFRGEENKDKMSSTNLFHLLSSASDNTEENVEETIEEMRSIIRNNEAGWKLLNYEGEGMVYCFTPILETDWYMVSTVPEQIIDEQTEGIVDNTVALFFAVMIAFVLLLALLIIREKQNFKKIHNENLLVKKMIFASVLKTSNVLLGVDIERDDYTVITNKSDFALDFNMCNNFSDIVKLSSELILPQYRKEYLEKFSISNLKKNIHNQKYREAMEIQAMGENSIHWVSVAAVSVETDDNISWFVYSAKIIDEEKEEKQNRRTILEEALNASKEAYEKLMEQHAINSALCSIYFATYYCHLSTGEYVEIVAPDYLKPIIAETGNTKEAFEEFISWGVEPPAREEMYKFTNIDTLRQRLRDVQGVTHDYESITKGWCRASWVVATRDENGDATNVMFVVSDVDNEIRAELEQKKQLAEAVENAKNANKAKSDFLSRMSHDIRTPMNAIVGMTEIAKRHFNEPKKVSECLDKINLESIHLQTLINDILDISAIEAGKISIAKEEVRFKDIIDNIEVSVRGLISARAIKYTYKEGNIFFPYLKTDSLRIVQIYLNLLSNAIKFTSPGGKVLFQVWQTMTKEYGRVYLNARIKDTGMGMSEEFMANMYNEFERAIDTRVNKIQGTGLGLSIVKQLLDLMGGTIEVKSEIGKGTEFKVVIPIEYIEKKDSRSKHVEDNIDYDRLKQIKVLVAEDNDLNYEIIREIFEDYEIDVTRAENGQLAYKLVEESKPYTFDVILMDMQMPVMDGLEATRAIRKINRDDTRNIPIIAMTANAYTEDAMECRAAGMDEHISKPLNISLVLRVILEQIENQKEK